MKLIVLGLILGVAACGVQPGEVHIEVLWGHIEPPSKLWVSGKIFQSVAGTEGEPRLLAAMAEAKPYESGMLLQFSEVPNGQNLTLLLEARAEASLVSQVLYYGSSEAFSLASGDESQLEIPVLMVEAPTLQELHLEEAVGPDDCPLCYASTSIVTLSFNAEHVAAVEVASDILFGTCKRTLVPNQASKQWPNLVVTAGEVWRIEGWDLDCGLGETGDGPRVVYVRGSDSEGYLSPTLSHQVILDREAPANETLTCADGDRLFELQTNMLFSALDAKEMWVEAYQPDQTGRGEAATIQGGLLDCDLDGDNISVEKWTAFESEGCVRLKDVSVNKVRVRYRDFAHNESPWAEWEFENVDELDLTWKAIPKGTFVMGCSSGDSECDDDETPPHSVTLSDFAVLETEVTVAQYEIVTGDNPSYDRGASDGLNAPVEGVDWYGAKEFCDAVDGRLCTEAEWEYAARGGTTTKYYCGDDESCLYQIAWYGSGSGGKKQEVGGKNPNEFGLYDMLGNVDEWVNDWYHDDYYSDSPQNDPGGPVTSDNKVRRGGGFDLGTLRVSYRGVLNPSGSGPVLGFRCCKSPDE